MPKPHSAARQFLAALDALNRRHREPRSEVWKVAGDVVGNHLSSLAGLAAARPPASPLATAVAALLPGFDWSLSESDTQPDYLSPLFLQTLFEAGLDDDARRQQGIVYTPLQTVRHVIETGLAELDHSHSTPLRIADPAAGSGAFLVHLAAQCPAATELVGLDPDPAALDVARTRLGLLRAATPGRHLDAHLIEGVAQDHLLGSRPFDLLVGNPPYVRHEERLPPAKAFGRELTDALGLSPGDRRVARLVSGRADLYATFFLLALAALRPGGVVAFVTSDSWLDARFGEDLQAVALESCDRIALHQESEQRAFGTTGVNTVITVMRRRQGPGSAAVQFVPAGTGAPSPPLATSPTPGKWAARFLRGGAATRRLQNHPLMVPLGSVANLTYGNKPGIRPFFVLPAATATRQVDQGFLRPVLASSKELRTYAVEPEELSHRLFVCPHSLAELKSRGHDLTVSWVTQGAKQTTRRGARHTRAGVPWPDVKSVLNNRPEWHSLALRPPGDFIIPSLLSGRLFVAHNSARIDNTNTFFHGSFAADIDPLLGLGLLNATVTYLLFEIYGRPKGLGGLNLYGPELKVLPIPDPKRLTLAQRRGIMDAFAAMRTRPVLPVADELGGGKWGEIPSDRRSLDSHVFEALGWSATERDAAYEELLAITSRRLEKGRKQR